MAIFVDIYRHVRKAPSDVTRVVTKAYVDNLAINAITLNGFAASKYMNMTSANKTTNEDYVNTLDGDGVCHTLPSAV